MKNIIVSIGIIYLMTMFMSFQKDANSLRLSNSDLQELARDSALYISSQITEKKKDIRDDELSKLLNHFLVINGCDKKIIKKSATYRKDTNDVEVKLDMGTYNYGLDFLRNDHNIVKTATVRVK